MFRRFAPIALLATVALAGCGADDNPRLLSQADADALLERIDEAERAVDGGRCDAARESLREASDQVGALPDSTSAGLRRNIDEWLTHLRAEVSDACEEQQPEETATPEETPTETPEETATPAPTPTEPPAETPTAEPTATPTPDTGGSSPGEGGGDG